MQRLKIDEKQIKDLKDQIWLTRVSRVNAEKRLMSKENFIQAMNIYYSCITVIFSIILLNHNNEIMSIINVSMTISLMISLFYFKSMKYSDGAINFRRNYTELQRLEMELKHITSNDMLREIEENYCTLLSSNENHSTHDYLSTMWNSKDSFKKGKWNKINAFKYCCGVAWRLLVKIICILLPLLIISFVYWGEYIGRI